MTEQVYDRYYDTVGNYHWTGVYSGKHIERGERMSDIKFYIPKDETIPTDLRLYVGDEIVQYERIKGGFRFRTLLDDEGQAMEIVKKIVDRMEWEHDESEHGVSWVTVSLEVVPQDERYNIGTIIDWEYRVRDSF